MNGPEIWVKRMRPVVFWLSERICKEPNPVRGVSEERQLCCCREVTQHTVTSHVVCHS